MYTVTKRTKVRYDMDIVGRIEGPTGRWRLVQDDEWPAPRMEVEICFTYDCGGFSRWLDEDKIKFSTITEVDAYR